MVQTASFIWLPFPLCKFTFSFRYNDVVKVPRQYKLVYTSCCRTIFHPINLLLLYLILLKCLLVLDMISVLLWTD
jgi:hypothetical protein